MFRGAACTPIPSASSSSAQPAERLKVEELGGHSLRAGCVTQAAMNGVREFVIMRQTGHKTIATLRRYIRSGEIFRENAAAGLGI
jgi:integrase